LSDLGYGNELRRSLCLVDLSGIGLRVCRTRTVTDGRISCWLGDPARLPADSNTQLRDWRCRGFIVLAFVLMNADVKAKIGGLVWLGIGVAIVIGLQIAGRSTELKLEG